MSQHQPPKLKVKVSHVSQIWQSFVNGINSLLVFLSLRKKRKFWGIVYDSVSKQPLDPVLLTLAYVGDSQAQTCITDMAGNYGFLAHAGKFKILAKKTNYSFPSKIVKGNRDGIFDNVYHGEFFELSDGHEVVAPNIPMDPEKFDWNQQAKLSLGKTHAGLEYLFKVLAGLIFWAGFILLCLSVWALVFRQFTGWPPPRNFPALYAAICLYFLLFLLAAITPQVRLWGKFKLPPLSEIKMQDILLELRKPELPGIVFGRADIEQDGTFFLRTQAGKYDVVAKEKTGEDLFTTLGQVSVKIGSQGLVNQIFSLIDGK